MLESIVVRVVLVDEVVKQFHQCPLIKTVCCQTAHIHGDGGVELVVRGTEHVQVLFVGCAIVSFLSVEACHTRYGIRCRQGDGMLLRIDQQHSIQDDGVHVEHKILGSTAELEHQV